MNNEIEAKPNYLINKQTNGNVVENLKRQPFCAPAKTYDINTSQHMHTAHTERQSWRQQNRFV